MVSGLISNMVAEVDRRRADDVKIEWCSVVKIDRKEDQGVQCHSPDKPRYLNTVSVKVRSKRQHGNPEISQHPNVPVLQHFHGNRFGEPYTPRVGDLVIVLFIHNNAALVLGPVVTTPWQKPVYRGPTANDAQYDWVWKWCQWLEPEEDINQDYYEHPAGRDALCRKVFHGPVTGKPGRGRDYQMVWDCQLGNKDPDCKTGCQGCARCVKIDSVPRCGEQWLKVYSPKTESCEALPSRWEFHARCGSCLRFESECECQSGKVSKEYTEGKGHIRLLNAICESCKKGHLNFNPKGTIDIHSQHEEVPISIESNGTRVIVVSPEDLSVDYAVEMINFETGTYIRIMKDGSIVCYSPTHIDLIAGEKITLNAPLIDEITELVHNHGNQQIDGTCTHGPCSCGIV